MADDTMLNAALDYAARGWRVFPLFEARQNGSCSCGLGGECPTIGKHPRIAGWQNAATSDPGQITRWWTDFPNASIGLACGRESGVFVVDLDIHGRRNGVESWASLSTPQRNGGVEADTITSVTGSGGQHKIFRYPEGAEVTNAKGDLPQEIDIRGNGGYIVLPPSRHASGNNYHWLGDAGLEVGEPPRWLLDKILTPRRKKATVNFAVPNPPRPDVESLGLKSGYVDMIMRPPKKGFRSEHDQQVITALVRRKITPDTIRAVFMHYPIGARGKYAEKGELGDDYLRTSIANAMATVAQSDEEVAEAQQEVITLESLQGVLDGGWENPWVIYGGEEPKEPQPIPYLVDDILTGDSLAIWHGPAESMKSLVLMDLCACVAAGKPWLVGDNFPGYRTTQGGTLWVDYDQGRYETQTRYNAFWRGHGLRPGTRFHFHSMATPILNIRNIASLKNFALHIVKGGYRLVVIDNLLPVSGGADENSNTEMAMVMSQFRLLVDITGIALIVIHHERKPTGEKQRPGTEVRGASAILGSLDFGISVVRDQNSKFVTLRPTKQRRFVGIQVSAVFEAQNYEPKMPDGRPSVRQLYRAYYKGLGQDIIDTDHAVKQAILQYLAGEVGIMRTQKEVVNSVYQMLKDDGEPVGIITIRNILTVMGDRGEVEVTRGKRTALLYAINRADIDGYTT